MRKEDEEGKKKEMRMEWNSRSPWNWSREGKSVFFILFCFSSIVLQHRMNSHSLWIWCVREIHSVQTYAYYFLPFILLLISFPFLSLNWFQVSLVISFKAYFYFFFFSFSISTPILSLFLYLPFFSLKENQLLSILFFSFVNTHSIKSRELE